MAWCWSAAAMTCRWEILEARGLCGQRDVPDLHTPLLGSCTCDPVLQPTLQPVLCGRRSSSGTSSWGCRLSHTTPATTTMFFRQVVPQDAAWGSRRSRVANCFQCSPICRPHCHRRRVSCRIQGMARWSAARRMGWCGWDTYRRVPAVQQWRPVAWPATGAGRTNWRWSLIPPPAS